MYLIGYHTEKESYRKPIFPQLNRLKERKLVVILALLYLKSQPQTISQGEISLLLTSREYFGVPTVESQAKNVGMMLSFQLYGLNSGLDSLFHVP